MPEAFTPRAEGWTQGPVSHQVSMGMLTSAFRESPVTLQEERTACLFAMLPASWNGACMLNIAFFSTQVLLAKGAVSKLTQACT